MYVTVQRFKVERFKVKTQSKELTAEIQTSCQALSVKVNKQGTDAALSGPVYCGEIKCGAGSFNPLSATCIGYRLARDL